MKTLKEYTEFRTVDKTTWGDGPWMNEPDKCWWIDEETGYWCMIVRNGEVTGALCGYVGVPKNHRYFQKTDSQYTDSSRTVWMREQSKLLEQYGDFRDIPEDIKVHEILEQHPDYEPNLDELSCHGGVTYTDDNKAVSEADWQVFRKRMLGRHTAGRQLNPYGDSARLWRTRGHCVDDFEAYKKWQVECQQYVPGIECTWIGFDCGHYMDYMPGMEATMNAIMPDREPKPLGDIYRGLAYVQAECRSLAKQLKELEHGQAESASSDQTAE